MHEALIAALALGEAALITAAAVFLRIAAAVAVLPAFGEQSLSMRIRLAAAVALTVLVAPAVGPGIDAEGWQDVYRLMASETAIGLVFGILLRLMILALQIAGTVIAQSTSLAQLFGGAGVDPMPAVGHLLVVGGLALAAMADLHLHVVLSLIDSYAVLPAGAAMRADLLGQLGVAHVARAFALAFTLAAPFVIGALVYNLALGAINRAMPQLMVAFVGAPFITWAGLALLALTAPMILELWHGHFLAVLARPLGAP